MTLKKAIQQAFGVTPSQLKDEFKKLADYGEVTMGFKHKQPKAFVKAKPLTIKYVIDQFRYIADLEGNNV